jgi:hypothetical protein
VRTVTSDHLVERAAGLAQLQAKIPERVEHRFDHALGPRRLLAGGKEADVDVRMWRHLGTAIATDRDQREALAGRRVEQGVKPLRREIEQDAEQRIDQIGLRT